MNVLEEMISQKKHMREVAWIDIDDIHPNSLNSAPVEHIDDLAQQIADNNFELLKPITIYKESNNNYVLLDGERRYTAFKKLDLETIASIVVDKPENETNEREWILDANSQREDTKKYKRARAQEYKEIFYSKKEAGEIENKVLMIDWVASKMNVSGRTIQRFLKQEDDEGSDPEVDRDVDEAKQFKSLIRKINKLADDLNAYENTCTDPKILYDFEIAVAYLKNTLENDFNYMNDLPY